LSKSTPLSKDEAKSKIELIIDQGIVKLSVHCQRDSMPAQGISIYDIYHALKTGFITKEPEGDAVHQQWKYRVEGMDLSQQELASIVVIFDRNLTL
jgi:hypothetical protein